MSGRRPKRSLGRTRSSATSIVASVIVMNVRCVDGMITMECQPEQNQGDSQCARRRASRDQGGVPCAQRSPTAGNRASAPMVKAFRLTLTIISPQRKLRRHEPELHRVQPDRATPRKLRRRSSTATVDTHSQEHQVERQPDVASQLMRLSASPAPLAMASHPTQRARNLLDAMTQPQQTAKLPRATRPLANAACPQSGGQLPR